MKDTQINDETRVRILRLVAENPNASQRELAEELGISLGKLNYCLKALIGVGWIKAGNFARSTNKIGYAYVLTPSGIKEKSQITARFLKFKQDQYELLKQEIEVLIKEVNE